MISIFTRRIFIKAEKLYGFEFLEPDVLLVELLIELLPVFELLIIFPFFILLFIVELLIDELPFDIVLLPDIVLPPDMLLLFDIALLFDDIEPPPFDIELLDIDELLFIIEFEFMLVEFVFAPPPQPKANRVKPATAPSINFLFISSPVFSNVNLRTKIFPRFTDKFLPYFNNNRLREK